MTVAILGIGRQQALLLLIHITFFGRLGPAVSATSTVEVVVSPNCEYSITLPRVQWEFRGRVLSDCRASHWTGEDRLGAFDEFQLDDIKEPMLHRAIRRYPDRSSVVFEISGHGIAVNKYQFPEFDKYPSQIKKLSYGHDAFSPVRFDIKGDAPWVFFDQNYNTFILSPLNHFMISNNFGNEQFLSVGIEPQVMELVDEFTFESVLTVGEGINATYNTWGRLLTDAGGKERPTNDADPVLSALGYWTDNRSSYWYNFVKSKGYERTLQDIVKEFTEQGLRLGHLQLDSWWYQKGAVGTREPSWLNFTKGIFKLEAAPDVFPKGLSEFQRSVGLPLIAHSRWVDPTSPYMQKYRFSNQVSIDPSYWAELMSYLESAGVKVYEQDWLDDRALPRLDRVADGDLFLDQMAAAARSHHLALQYCMPLPRHFLQGSRYSNLLTIRTSGDGLVPEKWQQFLFGSTLASALGTWPWTDVFFSEVWQNLLIANLSGGIVGVGDRLQEDVKPQGDFKPEWCGSDLHCTPPNPSNLRRAIRADGVVIKPDTALSPLDESYWRTALHAGGETAITAAAFTYEAGGVSAAYVFAYAPEHSLEQNVEIDSRSLGIPAEAVAYSYWDGKLTPLGNRATLRINPGASGTYWIVVPKRTSGLALFGDLDAFASMGKKRLSVNHEDAHSVSLRITFAAGESTLHISVLTPSGEVPKALSGTLGINLARGEPNTQLYTFALTRPSGRNEASQEDVQIEF